MVGATAVVLMGLAASPGISQAARASHKAAPDYYLSLGDSYSVGYQPNTDGVGGVATAGYTSVVAKKQKMQLENFGCGGATTLSILQAPGCITAGYGPVAATDAVDYEGTTQVAAAVGFIGDAANYGKVGLITVSIGGNDVTSCVSAGSIGAILTCVNAADASITTNVTSLVSQLSTALNANGDTTARIVGLTYPDVILGSYVNPGGSSAQTLASASVYAFDHLINPTLEAAYTSASDGSFINVTQAPYKLATAGDDTPLTTTVKLKPYGVVPVAVWEVCKLTYYCTLNNIHANTKGYDFIGKFIVTSLAG
jgi:lysophospholipase L1-like esterase